jgi:DNA-binding MarR family transcriptional regulator
MKQIEMKDVTHQAGSNSSIVLLGKILDFVKYFDYDYEMTYNQELIDRIRGFNRFYTNIIGLLDQHFLDSPFSLTEGRVLYEICNTEDCSAKKIRESIIIDEGYLSRILDHFLKRGLIRKTRSPADGRLWMIVPTEKGKREFASLNDNSNRLIVQMIEKLSGEERADLLHKMEGIRSLLEKTE